MLYVKFFGNPRLTSRLTSLYENTVSNINSLEQKEFVLISKSREEAEKLYSENNCIAISQIQKLREQLLKEFYAFKEEIDAFNSIELSKTLKKAFIHDVWCLVSEKIKELKQLRSNIDRIVTADLK